MGEFDFIARHFRPLAGEGAFELRNDGAVLSPPDGYEVAISSDTMVENLHFLPDDPADTIAQKLLRCNLSDLGAMGATPAGYMLNVSVPSSSRYDDAWFAGFSQGLAADQQRYHIALLGGDTTGSTGPLMLGLTIFGFVPKGGALRRDTARPGDVVWVTGDLGRAALGLMARQGKISDRTGHLVRAYRVPTPRVGMPLQGIASAAMDISDGLLQDAGHIARESHISLSLDEDRLPFSAEVREHYATWRDVCLRGGDDYELLILTPPEQQEALRRLCQRYKVPITQIGVAKEGDGGVTVYDSQGNVVPIASTGWQHF